MSLLDGLIASLKLHETAGTRSDSHDGHDGIEIGSVGSASGGPLGIAATSSQASDYLSVHDHVDLRGDAAITIATWAKVPEGATLVLASKVTQSNSDDEYWLSYVATGKANFDIAGADLSYPTAQSDVLTPDAWHFILAWWAQGEGIYLQVDNGSPQFQAFTGENVAAEAGSLTVCKGGDGLAAEQSLSFWRRVLTTDERTRLWNNGAGLDFVGGNSTDANYYYYLTDFGAELERERQLMAQMEAARRAVWQKPAK